MCLELSIISWRCETSDSAAIVIDHAFWQILCPHLRDLQLAKCDTCWHARSCLRAGKIAVDLQGEGRSGWLREGRRKKNRIFMVIYHTGGEGGQRGK